MTLRTTATNSDLDWLLDRLVDQVPGTRNAIVLSDDGLVVSQSSSIDRVDAERLAAIATGQQSLARGVGDVFGGGDRSTRSSSSSVNSGSSSAPPAGARTWRSWRTRRWTPR